MSRRAWLSLIFLLIILAVGAYIIHRRQIGADTLPRSTTDRYGFTVFGTATDRNGNKIVGARIMVGLVSTISNAQGDYSVRLSVDDFWKDPTEVLTSVPVSVFNASGQNMYPVNGPESYVVPLPTQLNPSGMTAYAYGSTNTALSPYRLDLKLSNTQ